MHRASQIERAKPDRKLQDELSLKLWKQFHQPLERILHEA